MPENSTINCSKISNKCSCCPYGFHIDRDFVRYCDSLYNNAQLDKLRQHKRERRIEKKSVESYLGLGKFSLQRSQNQTVVNHQDVDTSNSFGSGLQTTLLSLSKAVSISPHQTVGINKSVLTNIREQMASSLHLMKQLEEQVKSIPNLKVKISTLTEEKETLMKELKKEIFRNTNSNKNNLTEHQVKSLESERIMSPTFSRKCISLNHSKSVKYSSSPEKSSAIFGTSCLQLPRTSTENKLFQLKIDNKNIDLSNSKKSIGTSCTILTRDIGVGSMPNKSKSIAVGDDISESYYFNLYKRTFYDKQSISSGSLESDLDSLNSIGDVSMVYPKCQFKQSVVNDLLSNKNPSPKSFKNSFTNTECYYVDKCTNTEGDLTDFNNVFISDKSVRNKSISMIPVMRNKHIQVTYRLKTKDVGLQTSEVPSNNYVSSSLLYNYDVRAGDVSVTDMCGKCKVIKKSVGIGNYDINDTNCKKCTEFDEKIFTSEGVGDIDINITCLGNCQNKIHETRKVDSIGTNTNLKNTDIEREIYICDKCNETIQSVAQDLLADCNEKNLIFCNKSMKQTVQSKISKLKPHVTPLKIAESSTNVRLHSSVEVTKVKKYIQHESSPKDKDDHNFNIESHKALNKYSPEHLPTFTDIPVLPRKKFELNKEIHAACKVLNDHLHKSDHESEKKMLSSLKVIESEWFKVANQKTADPHLIEDYLDAFEEFSRLLLHKIVNLSDTNGNTALHYAVSYGNFDVVSILIDSKVCDVNLKNKAGYTSIMLVALAEVKNDTHRYVVQRLFSIGDINIKATQNGQTALMLAVSHGKKDIVKILLGVGAEINLQDNDGSTALMCAAEHAHLEIAKILLSHAECDPTIVDNDGCTALTIAMEAGNKDIGVLIYTNMNFSRGSSPHSTLKIRKRSTPRSTPPHTPTLRTPPLPSSAVKSMSSLTSFHFS